MQQSHFPCWQQQRGPSRRQRRRSWDAHYMPGIPRAAAHGDADTDADADAYVAPPATPATPVRFAAGRHAATYEL
eukprot:6210685-Pleurochrysis_carterae.AAC.1